MADEESTGEKTEEPTPERLRKLRKEGNVPKSEDVTHAVSFVIIFAVIAATMPFVGKEMIDLFHVAVAAARSSQEPGVVLSQLMLQGLISMLKACAPALTAALVLGVGLNLAQVGFLFSTKPITPDLERLNPVKGFKNLFDKKKVVELVKTTLKFVIVSYLSYKALKGALRDVVLIVRSDVPVGMKVIGSIVWDFCIKIGGAFVLIAAFDAFYQRRRYTKDNMMSKYDVKQEYKQSEGDPRYKAERRRFHQEILSSASVPNVKNADVVVRNPDHIAIALKYDKEKGGAPKVVAKGTRLWAEKILEAARKYGVPVVKNVPLAQALNKVDLDDDVPEDLYAAVAEVLNFVYSLAEEQKKKQGGR